MENASPVQVFPLSLLTYPKVQGHLNDPSVLRHSECVFFSQEWLPVAHSSISERYDRMQILVVKWFKSEETWFENDLEFAGRKGAIMFCLLWSSFFYAFGKTLYSHFISPQGITNVYRRVVGATYRNVNLINVYMNFNSPYLKIRWK